MDGGAKKKSTSLNNLHNANRPSSSFTSRLSSSASMSSIQPRGSRAAHTISSARSPLWTALTHAQTITDYVDSWHPETDIELNDFWSFNGFSTSTISHNYGVTFDWPSNLGIEKLYHRKILSVLAQVLYFIVELIRFVI